jgi:ubiquinone/menaquinone biosynthesis C-methylase UbiE
MHDAASHWNQLHESPRFRPSYPNDHVVRFLIATRGLLSPATPARFLDIGAGAGRHVKLAAELGYWPSGVDISLVGLAHAYQRFCDAGTRLLLAQASMLRLPFADQSFHAVLSFGVFYYGRAEEMKRAIHETHRVLARGGRAFVVLRTTADYRFGKGLELEPNTFELGISDTNELGTIQHFLAAPDIPDYFAAFREVSFEKTETTFANRANVNSDWLITAEK